MVFQLRDSGPPAPAGLNSVPVLTVGWSWPSAIAVLALSLVIVIGVHRLRRQGLEDTSRPRRSAPASPGASPASSRLSRSRPSYPEARVPDASIYGTRIRLFPLKLLIFFIAVAMMATLHLLLQETKLGTAMRAASDNLDLAKVTGINTDRVMMATWILAGLFAGLAGVMLGLSLSRVQVNIGFFLLLPMFAAVILGGIRSIYGVIVGSFVVGLAMDVGFTVLPVGNEFRVPLAFAVLFLVLLVKPEGLVGRN